MKILLVAINAKYIHSNLAVHTLRAASGEYASSVEIAEYTINQTKDAILQDIYLRRPDVLCFSCYIWNIRFVESLAASFHKLSPGVPVWVGGPEVSFEVENFLQKHDYIQGVMIGEGEATFREMCGYFLGEKKPEDIPGIAFCREGEVFFTAPREITDLNSIPFCYEGGDFANRIIYYESSRGCPFSCSYCLSSVDKKLRFREASRVKEELIFFLDRKVPQVKFVDRTFNCAHDHAMEIWQFIRDHDNGITNFHFEISADLITEEEVELLSTMRPGLVQLEIGVQSTNESTLREIRRSMKLDRLKEVVKRIQQVGNIHQHLDLIAGLPYEGFERFRQSFDEVFALRPDQLQLGFLKVLKGSYLYEMAEKYGIVYQDEPPYEVLYTNWISYGEILRIKQVEEMLEVYYNSGQFETTIKLALAKESSAFDFFLRLGALYEKKGYHRVNHTRLRRAEILLEFLQEEGVIPRQEAEGEEENPGEMFREALTFDLYLRENCKTRPTWAPGIGTLREMTRRYCPDGKLSHIEPFHYRFPDRCERVVREYPGRLAQPEWILFHYDRRVPPDHRAFCERCEGGETGALDRFPLQ